MYPHGYEISKVRSNQTVNYSDFNGDITFNFCSEAEKWISPKNSFITVQMRVVQTDEVPTVGTLRPIVNAGTRAAPTVVAIPFINNNPIPSLFSAISCEVGNQTVSMNQYVPGTITLYKTLYESRSEQYTVNSLCPIVPLTQLDTDVTQNKPSAAILHDYYGLNAGAAWPADPAIQLTNHQLYALKQQCGFNRFNEVELSCQIPTSLFLSDQLIPPNTPITLKLTVDSAWWLNFMNIAGSTVAGLGGGPISYSIAKLTSATSTQTIANTIGVGVRDMWLNLFKVHMADAVSVVKEIYVKQFSALTHTVPTGSTADEFNVSFTKNRRITHIVCAFTQPKTTIKCTPTDFSTGFTSAGTTETIVTATAPITQLNLIRIMYAGATYPNTDYNLNFDNTTPTSNDLYKAYYDFTVNSDAYRDRNGCLMSFDQWTVAPIFIWKTHQPPNNDDNSCLITVNFKTAIAGCNILVVGYYDDVIRLSYNEYGKYDKMTIDG